MTRIPLVILSMLLVVPLYAVRAEAPQASGRLSVQAQLALAARDAHNLALAQPGQRNLYDLTRQLKLHSLTPIYPYVRTTAPSYNVGRVDTFWVAQATTGYFAMKATLIYKTAHAYWYVEQNSGIPPDKLLAAVRASANDFETRVYPTDRAAFGGEWTPGIDRDPHITILCANLPGVGGYYSAEDLYPTAVNAYSNQRKMLYVNIDSYPLGTPDFSSTIAHEFQHMIHWYHHENDDTWINEGSSVLAQVLNGYTPDGQDAAYAAAPGTQLDWFCYGAPYCSDSAASAYYGGGFLWMFYLYQHYGGDQALRTMLSDNTRSGMLLFDDVLARLGSRDTARDMFAKFAVANYVDDPTLDGGIYGYKPAYAGCCVHAATTITATTYPFTRQASVNQFATHYVELKPGTASTLHIQFSGDPTVRIVPNTPLQNGTEWWSNRGDELDSTLTRAFDLHQVHRATLQYDVWYALEKDYDYGYVEVSTDNGRTWHTLHGRYTTNGDPNGANYGNGYTGSSVKQIGNQGGWLHENIDLSPYTGRSVLVRFEEITDDAFNLSGVTLDNIRVPEIGYADDGSGSGWQSKGWVRVSNYLPTHWLVQMIEYTIHGVQVRQMALAPTASGQATISGFGSDVRRVVLAISPTAPQTTIPSTYTLQVQ